jgi:hypothetical protein
MSSRHERTLAAVFERPTLANISWRSVESMLRSLNADLEEGAGSRLGIVLNGVTAVIHRPHEKEISKANVKKLREFLSNAGVEP